MEGKMRFLRVLEWAFGAFLIVFVVWQIAAPLLMGHPPFSWFIPKRQNVINKTEEEEKTSNE